MKCRVCDGRMNDPILSFTNMPQAAQHLPEEPSDTGIDMDVMQCEYCGTVQLSSDPVSYYKDVIRASAFSEEMRQFRVQQFKEFISKYRLANKKVVEIGCGKGEFLSLMKEAGADTYGIEYADDSVAYCRERDLQVSKFYIENEDDILPSAPFDCFFIMNFFEHLPDPNTTLKVLHSNLADDGVGLVEVPNFDMIVKNKLFSEFINDHLFYFTQKTLKSILDRNGFEIVECEETWYNYIISAVVRKKKKLNLSRFYDHQLKIKKEIQSYIHMYGDKKVAIYGAGHQALAAISLAEIGDKIKYVVDDAPFKQGRYTPATHVPIVSSEFIKKDPVDAIIVMAASYSDEVARKLGVSHPDIDLTILRDFGLE